MFLIEALYEPEGRCLSFLHLVRLCRLLSSPAGLRIWPFISAPGDFWYPGWWPYPLSWLRPVSLFTMASGKDGRTRKQLETTLQRASDHQNTGTLRSRHFSSHISDCLLKWSTGRHKEPCKGQNLSRAVNITQQKRTAFAFFCKGLVQVLTQGMWKQVTAAC